jgi:uncharacterized damage-inducible protein DinB
MQTEIDRITDQLKRAVEGEAWHGPSLQETLADISAETAAARPLAEAHTAWEIALHIGAWLTGVRRRLEGHPVELSHEEDWPAMGEKSEAAWERARASLDGEYRELYDAVRGLSDESLERIVPGRDYNVYFMLHGVIQHILYHTGQIGVLKRAKSKPR